MQGPCALLICVEELLHPLGVVLGGLHPLPAVLPEPLEGLAEVIHVDLERRVLPHRVPVVADELHGELIGELRREQAESKTTKVMCKINLLTCKISFKYT